MSRMETTSRTWRCAGLYAGAAFSLFLLNLPAAGQVYKDVISFAGGTLTPLPDWHLSKNARTAFLLMGPPSAGPGANLNLVIQPAPRWQTLEQGRAQIVKVYPHLGKQARIIRTGYEQVGNARALLVVGTILLGTRPLLIHQAIVTRNGKTYTFTCTSVYKTHTQSDPAFTQMLHSVRWSR